MITSVTTCTHLRVFPRFFLCYRLYFKNMPRARVGGERKKCFRIIPNLIELTGNTRKGARVMLNGSEMPIVNSEGQFRHCNAAPAGGRGRDYGHGADGAGGREDAAEKDCDSVKQAGQ